MGEDATAQMQCQSNHLPIVRLPGITGKSSLGCFLSVHVLIWKYSKTFFERGQRIPPNSHISTFSMGNLWYVFINFFHNNHRTTDINF